MIPTGSDDALAEAAALEAKYLQERDKRMIEGRGEIRDLTAGPFAGYRHDPFTPMVERPPVVEDVEVLVVGAGIAGLVLGARLRERGHRSIRHVDEAGGVGGTWYWNRYPGVMCDVESYIYLPMLEELGYVPRTRYAFGAEILSHLRAIAQRYDLEDGALFHTAVTGARWDEGLGRWVVATDRGDEIRARHLVMAVGILNRMKLPALPGMEDFRGRSFHTARWDYAYTGGGPDTPLDGLADKAVAVIGTGASAIQCVPPLAASARSVVVLQRTPNVISERGNRPTPPEFARDLGPGWQRDRMANFQGVMTGRATGPDLVDDGWTRHGAPLYSGHFGPEVAPEDVPARYAAWDLQVMQAHRARIESVVEDPGTAEALKPWFHYLCKRPCFHDEYLAAYNSPNVTLVDCPAGIERVTPAGVLVDGVEYAVDCIVYATGFEPESTPLVRRAGFDVIGSGGVGLREKWSSGYRTLHGIMTSGFPNMFVMPGPLQQSVTTINYTHLAVEGALHVAEVITQLGRRGVGSFRVTPDAENAWVDTVLGTWVDRSAMLAGCTPSRANNEGRVDRISPLSSAYGGGLGDWEGYFRLLADWRAEGSFAGLELTTPAAVS